jgi:hypothetical protein
MRGRAIDQMAAPAHRRRRRPARTPPTPPLDRLCWETDPIASFFSLRELNKTLMMVVVVLVG